MSRVDTALEQARTELDRLRPGSFAAESSRRIGLRRATDVIGGVEAWLAAGLPTTQEPADVRE